MFGKTGLTVVLLLAAMLAGGGTAYPAAVMSDTEYSVTRDVLSAGGGQGQSGDYKISGTVGQSAGVGQSTGGGYQLSAGFWVPTDTALAESLGDGDLPIQSGGGGDSEAWQSDPSGGPNGGAAAESGPTTPGNSSWVQATVEGPGLVCFQWRVSSAANRDYLRFYRSGVLQAGISGLDATWQYRAFSVPAGSQTLVWSYEKAATDAVGQDRGWVAEVVFAPNQRRLMYRAYDPYAGGHFFTLRSGEFVNAVAAGFLDETTGYTGRLYYMSDRTVPGALELLRLYDPWGGQHYLTTNQQERNILISLGWLAEHPEGWLFRSAALAPPDTVEVYALYNSNTGGHLFTSNPAEVALVLTTLPGWGQHQSRGWAYRAAAATRAAGQPRVPGDDAAWEDLVRLARAQNAEGILAGIVAPPKGAR
ncbi:MAG: hypothetical protein KQJ78_23730 [Deltaproteobacteria bacterium]|nr:hypothetical protein [Deltaproteobacteria bacterium]